MTKPRLPDSGLPPGRQGCVVVRASLPEMEGDSLKVALVCGWQGEGEETGGGLRTAVVGCVCLRAADAARGLLDCSETSLSLWRGGPANHLPPAPVQPSCPCLCLGERMLCTRPSNKCYQDLACLLATCTHTKVNSVLLQPRDCM